MTELEALRDGLRQDLRDLRKEMHDGNEALRTQNEALRTQLATLATSITEALTRGANRDERLREHTEQIENNDGRLDALERANADSRLSALKRKYDEMRNDVDGRFNAVKSDVDELQKWKAKVLGYALGVSALASIITTAIGVILAYYKVFGGNPIP